MAKNQWNTLTVAALVFEKKKNFFFSFVVVE